MHMACELTPNVDLRNTFAVSYGIQALPAIDNIPTPTFSGTRLVELWQGMFDKTHQDGADWNIYHNDQYLIASVPKQILSNNSIDIATEIAYSQIFKLTKSMDFPYLLRTWNYIPNITEVSVDESNHYQLFCSGRTRAYDLFPREHVYPAATVVGTQQEGINIFFIASKSPGLGLENPQQISAFHYPEEYSKDPPLFSRAVIHRNDSQEIIFVSGTASILGHSTLHAGSVIKQLDVCLDNIRQLLITAAQKDQFQNIAITDMTQLKVYIKHSADFIPVREHLENVLGDCSAVCYVQGDLCRDNLLVEIEALAIKPLA